MSASLGRIITAMVTPFAADGSLDLEVARELARHLAGHGSEGLVLAGTTGEGPVLDDGEKLALLEAVADEVGDRASIVMNTGTYDTRHSVHLTREAVRVGADAVLVVTPYYSKPPVAGIVRHFAEVARAADDRPVIVYNIPQRVVVNLAPEVLFRLAEIDNVVAVKQATPDPDQARAVVEHGGLALYAGNDDLVLPFARLGGVGGITVASHVAGEDMLELVARVEAGDLDRAGGLDDGLRPLYEALSVTTNPIPVKAALELSGFAVGAPRLPLVAADERERAVVRDALVARNVPVGA